MVIKSHLCYAHDCSSQPCNAGAIRLNSHAQVGPVRNLEKETGETMSTAEKILEQLQNLPESVQAEVLDFVSYLEAKTKNTVQEPNVELEISLLMAMRGMEDEDVPEYSRDDLKEVF